MNAKFKSKLNQDKKTPLETVIPLESPYLLYVDPASACNFRCQFCPTGHVDLVRGSEYQRGVLKFDLFKKVIDDLAAFSQPLKVMRMNKIGEPLLNKNLPKMVRYAKDSGRVETIDLATNGSLFTRDLLFGLVDAGLDRINVSLEGINREQYQQFARVDFDFDAFVETFRWLYQNRGQCEITIKIPGNYVDEAQRQLFLDTFAEHCDRIFVEELAPIWPEFDVQERTGLTITTETGQYAQPLEEKMVCTYIFYAMAVNADGTVSACCPDWDQKLVVGNVHEQSLQQIWTSEAMRRLQIQHLEGRRKEMAVCKDCGHVKYAQVDTIDAYREVLLQRLQAGKGEQ